MSKDWRSYAEDLKGFITEDYRGMFRPAGGAFLHPFLTPGSSSYDDVLWDWDSWWSNVALAQVLEDQADEAAKEEARQYERGNILNFLEFTHPFTGWMPIVVNRGNGEPYRHTSVLNSNMHKPCLAQHAAFLVKRDGGDASWLREGIEKLMRFVNCYHGHYRHLPTGLMYWKNDHGVGVDDDPGSYGRPDNSCASIYLNCLMVKEFEALVYLLERLNLGEIAVQYRKDGETLKQAIQEHCWDEWTGFYYNCDILMESSEKLIEKMHHQKEGFVLHTGRPRSWECLIQRIGVWSGFMALWAGVADEEQARRVVEENYKNEKTFHAPYGVRTLSKLEKMYNLRASGNPSTWLGPIWGISNYMTWSGLLRYGYEEEARDLAQKTVQLFGQDLEKHGALHEYYTPENGEAVLNHGFQNWNYLVMNMIAWLEGRPHIHEF